MILYTALSFTYVHQIHDLLPLLASYCTCFALYIFSGIKTKLAFITANIFLFNYSWIVFSIGGMISMAAGIVLGLFTIWRMVKIKAVPAS